MDHDGELSVSLLCMRTRCVNFSLMHGTEHRRRQDGAKRFLQMNEFCYCHEGTWYCGEKGWHSFQFFHGPDVRYSLFMAFCTHSWLLCVFHEYGQLGVSCHWTLRETGVFYILRSLSGWVDFNPVGALFSYGVCGMSGDGVAVVLGCCWVSWLFFLLSLWYVKDNDLFNCCYLRTENSVSHKRRRVAVEVIRCASWLFSLLVRAPEVMTFQLILVADWRHIFRHATKQRKMIIVKCFFCSHPTGESPTQKNYRNEKRLLLDRCVHYISPLGTVPNIYIYI